MSGRLFRWVPILSVALLLLVGYPVIHWMLEPPVSPADHPPLQSLEVPEGTTFQQVARQLEEKGIIKNRRAFAFLSKLTMTDRSIKPGEYVFHAGMKPMDILSDLHDGKTLVHQVTFPEGFTLVQIANRLERHGLVDKQKFLELANDPEFIQSFHLGVPDLASLEGYLFPTTYQFEKFANPEHIIRTMVAFSQKAFTTELRQRAKSLNMTIHEVLTLASLVEKETGVPEERPVIAGVFHNRLRKDFLLQSDPTVIYALEDFDGNLRKRDLSIDHPYNTYRYKGLPPGPISNPGLESIRAALFPEKNSYLYFVSRNDGTHHFSSTLQDHNRAVDKFQRRGGHVS